MPFRGNLAVAFEQPVEAGWENEREPTRHDRHRAWARVVPQADVRSITHRKLCELAGELRTHRAITDADYAALTSTPPWLFDRQRDYLRLWQTRLAVKRSKKCPAHEKERIWRVLDILNYWTSLRAG